MWRKSVYLWLILGGFLAGPLVWAASPGSASGGSSESGAFRPHTNPASATQFDPPATVAPPEPDSSARFRPLQKPRIRSATEPQGNLLLPSAVSPFNPGFAPTPQIYPQALSPATPGYPYGYPSLGYPGMNMSSPYGSPTLAPVAPSPFGGMPYATPPPTPFAPVPYGGMPYATPLYPMPYAPGLMPYWGRGW